VRGGHFRDTTREDGDCPIAMMIEKQSFGWSEIVLGGRKWRRGRYEKCMEREVQL